MILVQWVANSTVNMYNSGVSGLFNPEGFDPETDFQSNESDSGRSVGGASVIVDDYEDPAFRVNYGLAAGTSYDSPEGPMIFFEHTKSGGSLWRFLMNGESLSLTPDNVGG